jgi:hypothetical protein
VIVTPHIGGVSDILVEQVFSNFVERLCQFLRGEKVKELQKNKKVMVIIKRLSNDISNENVSNDATATKILDISHMIVDKKLVGTYEIFQEKVPCTICFK